jgi:hypothetical protein
MPLLDQFDERRLQTIVGKLGVPQDSLQEPPQLLAVLDIQSRHDGRFELVELAFLDLALLNLIIIRGWHTWLLPNRSAMAASQSIDALGRQIIDAAGKFFVK